MQEKYDHKEIEKRWQKKWQEENLYKTPENLKGLKAYVLDMFPYPSGDGLHVGHPKGYIATDVYSRMKKMQGFNVLHPMGFDAFGLPAENYAIKNKIHPRIAVEKNIKRFKEQLDQIGFNYDWERQVNTTDPEYYKWTQWAFLKMLEKGLAYQSHEPINWCPSCQTGLANEDLESGLCERCGSVVEKRSMRQWVLKITDYAERLLTDLDILEWPEYIKESQRNWIGKSEGVEISFKLKAKSLEDEVKVFTTRVDTIFGVTYLVVAPEYEKIEKWKKEEIIKNWDEVEKYIKETKNKNEIERTSEGKEKTGVKLNGITVINPANGEEVPVFIADYVLGNYGTGAVMAVPAHDDRDFTFAKKYNLPIKQVIEPLFVSTTGLDAVQKDKPFAERDAIMAIVKHWSEDKYIGLKWKKVDWQTVITGGPEKNQTQEEAAICEITEETGYLHPRLVRKLSKVHSQFYHVPKQINRFAHFDVFYFELENRERQELSEEENEIHEVKWLSKKEMGEFIGPLSQKFAWNELINGIQSYTEEGILTNSGEFNGLTSEKAREKITEKFGNKVIKYKLRDWVFSRQRYWGEPIPVVHCEKCGVVAIPEKDLPVRLPEVENYEPTGTGESPLANITEWINTVCPKCGGPAKRETNTMPQWAGSSWYYLRYIDPKNNKELVGKEKEKYWSPVDMYVGGAEHATRHLIYARFWHKFLYDIGVVNYKEPFMRFQNVGLILAQDGKKMSKRFGNVINPDDIIEAWGADSLRLYEMFMGPFADSIAWNTDNMIGVRRFLEKVWRLAQHDTNTPMNANLSEWGRADDTNKNKKLESSLHKTIKKVTEDIENYKFNTAISTMMIFANEVDDLIGSSQEKVDLDIFEIFLKLLAPFAPHITEEIWHELGNKNSIHLEKWPEFEESKIMEENVTFVVQINGKIRAQFEAGTNFAQALAEAKARAMPEVQKWLVGQEVKKVVFVPNKIINFVV